MLVTVTIVTYKVAPIHLMQRFLTARVRIHMQQRTGDATVVLPQYTRNTDVGH